MYVRGNTRNLLKVEDDSWCAHTHMQMTNLGSPSDVDVDISGDGTFTYRNNYFPTIYFREEKNKKNVQETKKKSIYIYINK